MNVSAVIVTRGDVDLQPILDDICWLVEDVVVWDNSTMGDFKVYGRYCAIDRCKNDYIYTQDDDAHTPIEQILSAYTGHGLMVNVPEDEDWPWLAWGSIFPRNMAEMPFKVYLEHFPKDDLFHKWADIIFAEFASPIRRVSFGHTDLPWATAADRMYREPDHYTGQEMMRSRCQALLSTLASLS